MTAIIMVEPTGEARLRRRKRAFVKLTLTGGLIGGFVGLVVGITGGFSEGWQRAGGPTIGWLMWPVLAVSLIVFARYCVRYFGQVDELDVQDNLWASLIGLYGVLMGFPCWLALHKVGQLGEPSAKGVWIIGIVVACIAYGWRKLAHRF